LGHFPAYGRDPLGFVTRVAAEFGGVVPIRLGPYPTPLITDPAAIEEVLVTRNRDFRKSSAVMTLFMAGHETTALALTWALHQLAGTPRAQDALERELDHALGERSTPTVADVPALRYVDAVILETLRLFPPAYAISREAAQATTIAGRPVAKERSPSSACGPPTATRLASMIPTPSDPNAGSMASRGCSRAAPICPSRRGPGSA
jgi:hypothetical protein